MKRKHSNREGLRERPLLSPSILSNFDTILTGTSCHWAGVVFPVDRTYFRDISRNGFRVKSSKAEKPLPLPTHG